MQSIQKSFLRLILRVNMMVDCPSLASRLRNGVSEILIACRQGLPKERSAPVRFTASSIHLKSPMVSTTTFRSGPTGILGIQCMPRGKSGVGSRWQLYWHVNFFNLKDPRRYVPIIHSWREAALPLCESEAQAATSERDIPLDYNAGGSWHGIGPN